MTKSECLRLLGSFYLDVSHETVEKLSRYVDLLLKWNRKINLISQSTVEDIWLRHILDSAQLVKFIDLKDESILDIGSGAGLPGIVLSILGAKNIVLVDSDQRKCSFLQEVARILGLNLQVINDRIENLAMLDVQIVTCRGFASINNIFEQITRVCYKKILIFKGKNYKNEIAEAEQHWNFKYLTYISITDPDAHILDITDVRKK